MDDETAVAKVTGVAQVFDLHALKAFAPDKRVRKMLFKSDQLWSEIACYEPGQSTVMHRHPKEEEAIFVLEGTANMNIDGQEVVVPAGALVKFPTQVLHDVRNLGSERCVIMFIKVNPKVLPERSRGAAMGHVARCSRRAPQSRVWSARISTDCGIGSPSALAVLRLTRNSNLVGCSTGSSAGFAPLRILST